MTRMLTGQDRYLKLPIPCLFKKLKKKVKTSIQLITTAANVFYVQYAQFALKKLHLSEAIQLHFKRWQERPGRQLSNTISAAVFQNQGSEPAMEIYLKYV